MMKKNVLSMMLVMGIMLFAGVVHAAAIPNVVVSGYDIKEGNATVGKDFTLLVHLLNTEQGTCAQGITTSIQAGAPFIMRGVTSIQAGSLCSPNGKTVEIPLRVDPSGSGGFYQITIINDYETTLFAQYSSKSVLNIFVAGTPVIHANIAKSAPVDVYPGDTALVTVNVQNDGSFQAQSVTASLVAPSPLEVKWASTYASLGVLGVHQAKTADFSVKVPKDAPANDYDMRLHVTYLDEGLAQHTKDIDLTFHVAKKAQFSLTDAADNTLYANQNSKTVRLLVTNTGTDVAKNIRAKLQPQFPFSTDGSVRYIASLQPGESAPAVFVVNIDKDGTPGDYGLNVIFDFEDTQGTTLQETADVSLMIAEKSFFRAVFRDYWFLWLLVILLVTVIVRKRFAASKKQKK